MDHKLSLLAQTMAGEIHTDAVYRETFASAACLYRILPAAVAIPKDGRDVGMLLEFASSEKTPVTPRGAGSAVAGQSLGSGIVINLTKYFNRILEVRPDEKKVLVEPGVIFADLNRALKPAGLFFPPDPSSGNYCSLGGMIANNSSGAHSLYYGATQNYVEELEVVLADGSRAVVGKNKFELKEEKSYWAHQLRGRLEKLFIESRSALERDRPRVKNASGYLVWAALENDGIDYAKLLVGSEGTLAVILKAWLRVEPLPQFKSAGLIYFKDLDAATRATLMLKPLRPQAIEIMDRNFIKIVRDYYPQLRPLLDDQAEFMLLCEFDGASAEQAQEKIRAANEMAVEKERLGYKSVIAQDARERDLLWSVRQAASPILYRLGTGLVRFVEDIVIPPERLTQGLGQISEIFAEFKTYAPVMGHAGEGNLHLNPSFNPAKRDDQRRMQVFADRVYKLVIGLGGSVSGEHGDGIMRAPYVPTQFPHAFQAFKDLKRAFDPLEILNPGKILAEPGLIPVDNIKYFTPSVVSSRVQERLDHEDALELIFRCHGCGLCRTYCPGLKGFEDEITLPRSKVSIARALAQGLINEDELKSPEMKKLLAACYSCSRCLNLCPTGVEVPRIVEMIKSFSRETGLPEIRREILDRSGDIINLAGRLPTPALRLAASGLARLGMKAAGINAEASSLFTAQDVWKIKRSQGLVDRKSAQKSELKIIFFPGCLENWMDPQVLEHTGELLDSLGAEYETLTGLCCGMPSSTCNQPMTRAAAEKFAAAVLPKINRGYKLLTNCPSCLHTFRYTYPVLLGEDGEKIAEATISIYDLKELPMQAATAKAGPGFVYHRTCHMIGLGEPDPVLEFLKTVPGLKPAAVVEQCCGSGGSFELKQENKDASDKIAAILKAELEKTGAKIVASPCGLCRRKIRALGFDAISPVELLQAKRIT